MKLGELDILEIGHTIQVAGVIYGSTGHLHLCLLPDEKVETKQFVQLELDMEDWKKVIEQTDLLMTEVMAKSSDGQLAKIIIRKSTRQIEQGVSWNVFRRDGYRCRYCWNDKVPLTVDHLVLWEDGGPSIEDNLVSACRKCNKSRGRLQYADWLKSAYYLKVKRGLPGAVQTANDQLVDSLFKIPKRLHQASR